MTYSEKLRDPRWQKKRLIILDRDKWSCLYCHRDSITLNVHHLKYLPGKDPWDIEDKYLITLCEECHERESEDLPLCKNEAIDSIYSHLGSTHNLIKITKIFENTSLKDWISGDNMTILRIIMTDEEMKKKIMREFRNSRFKKTS